MDCLGQSREPFLFLLPVRRRLVCCALFYVLGIRLAPHAALPMPAVLTAAALLAAGLVFLLRTRRSALLCCALLFLICGYARMERLLLRQDMPTGTGAEITGCVVQQLDERRFVLEAVRAEGRPLQNPVRVTLLEEEGVQRSVPLPGMTLRGRGRLFTQRQARNPGGRDMRLSALADGYGLSGYILPGWTAEGAGTFSLPGWFDGLRSALCGRIDAVFGSGSPLFCALLAGDRKRMDADTVSALRRTGIVHILTISGLHIGLIALALSRLLRRLPMPQVLRTALLFLIMGFYALLTGLSPGTARALVMMAVREAALLRGRKYDRLSALAAAALVLTGIRPALAFSLSFLFSFTAVWGIALLAPAFERLTARLPLPGRLKGLSPALAFCLAAQLSVLPMQLQLYGYIPLLGVPLNLALAALLPALLLGGFAALLLSLIRMEAGAALGAVLSAAGEGLEEASRTLAERTQALCRLPAPGTTGVLLLLAAFALAGTAVLWGRGRKRVLLFVLAAFSGLYLLRFDPGVRYVQLDVGQGDGALLRRGRHAVLCDAGPASSYDMLNYLRYEGLFADALILSHLDEDHAGAALRLLTSEIGIGCLYTAEKDAEGQESETVREAWRLAQEKGIPIRHVLKGGRIEEAGFTFDVLSPEGTQAGDNERSLLLLCEEAGTRLLLTGDLPIAAEPEEVPGIDVLKVAHHGSRHATSRAFLNAAAPEIAVISAGEGNHYGHPADRVLRDLSAVGAEVYRTDRAGCVTIRLDQGRRKVTTYLRCGAEEWLGEDLK